ncbi:MAG: hypothetical protein LBT42_00075, partial [Tannerella sp.]|nr:hypothetical protein [Tannerella sp.]
MKRGAKIAHFERIAKKKYTFFHSGKICFSKKNIKKWLFDKINAYICREIEKANDFMIYKNQFLRHFLTSCERMSDCIYVNKCNQTLNGGGRKVYLPNNWTRKVSFCLFFPYHFFSIQSCINESG